MLGFLSYCRLQINQPGSSILLLCEIKQKNAESELVAEGRISSHINSYNGGCSFFFKAEKIEIRNKKTGSQNTFEINDVFYVLSNTPESLELKRDDFLRFSFIPVDREDKNYFLTYSDNISIINKLNVNAYAVQKMEYLIFRIRQKFYTCISQIFYRSLKYEQAAFCEAVLLGNRNNLSKSINEDFKKSGIYHLLAISGLHISFFIYICSILISFFGRLESSGKDKRGKRSIFIFMALIAAVLIYNFITGARASALRATFMTLMVIYARHLSRDYSKKYILSISFISLLIFSPSFFYDCGFWLSFASMFAIVYTSSTYDAVFKVLKEKINKRYYSQPESHKRNYFYEIALNTISVNIFIFPLLVYMFKEFTFLALPANLAVMPLFYILMFILFASSFSGLFWPPAGMALLKPAKYLITPILKMSSLWKNFNFAVINLQSFKAWHIFIYYFILAALLVLLYIIFIKKRICNIERGIYGRSSGKI